MAFGCRTSLLSFDVNPPAMENYLSHYGYHFSKSAYEWAVSLMRKMNPNTGEEEPVTPVSKDEVKDILQRYGVELKHDMLYDAAYVATMCKADLYGDSVPDEMHMAKYIKNRIDDPDQRPGYIFVQWYAALMLAGIPVSWDDIL